MKKVLVAILAIVYLSTSMGATVHLHYCMGRLVAWGLTGQSGKTCRFCGMQQMGVSGDCVVGMKDCCHEEYKQIKNNHDQKIGQDSLKVTKMVPVAAVLPREAWTGFLISAPAVCGHYAKGPPPDDGIPVFLRNCTFRI